MNQIINKSKTFSIQGLEVYILHYRNTQTGGEFYTAEVITESNINKITMLFPYRENMTLTEQDKKSLNEILRAFKKIWFN